jgi:hypothetical protein
MEEGTMRSSDRRIQLTVTVSSLVLFAAALAGCGSASDSDSDSDSVAAPSPSVTSPQSPTASAVAGGNAKDDAKITSCALDAASGKAVMKVDVTNNTAAEATYTFDVTIIAGPNKTPYAVTPLYPALIQSLASGQTEAVEYTTTATVEDPIVCRINNLKRR